MDLFATYKVDANLGVRLNVGNVFDRDYYPAVYRGGFFLYKGDAPQRPAHARLTTCSRVAVPDERRPRSLRARPLPLEGRFDRVGLGEYWAQGAGYDGHDRKGPEPGRSARIRALLDKTAWPDAQTVGTAGSLARLVKNNQQLDEASPLAVDLGNRILRKLAKHDQFTAYAHPQR